MMDHVEMKFVFRTICVVVAFVGTLFGCSQDLGPSSTPAIKPVARVPHNLQPEVWVATRTSAVATDGGPVDQIPQLLHSVTPKYPELPKEAGLTGYVVIEVIVSSKGDVKQASVVSSEGVSIVMRESALESVRAFMFQPGLRKSDPIECKMEVVANFDLK